MSRHRARLLALLVALAQLAVLACQPPALAFEFTTPEEDAERFLAWERSIVLDAEQQRVMDQALEPLPAPCCSDRSAATCCCPCNLARAWWGLSKHLIAAEGASAEEVRATVEEWFERVNPQGFSGNVCYTGGCARPWKANGCGGMTPEALAVS